MSIEQNPIYNSSYLFRRTQPDRVSGDSVSFYIDNPLLSAYEASEKDPQRHLHCAQLAALLLQYPHIPLTVASSSTSLEQILAEHQKTLDELIQESEEGHRQTGTYTYKSVLQLLHARGIDPEICAKSESMVLTLPHHITNDATSMTSLLNVLTGFRLLQQSVDETTEKSF